MNRNHERVIRTIAALNLNELSDTDMAALDVAQRWCIQETARIDKDRADQAAYKARQAERAGTPRKSRLAQQSAKRKSERTERAEVRRVVMQRDRVCQGPARGLPDECGTVSMHRPALEVHETHQRSTHPGSHLNPDLCVLLCQHHHDLCTSPSGDLRVLVEAAGLIVRASS